MEQTDNHSSTDATSSDAGDNKTAGKSEQHSSDQKKSESVVDLQLEAGGLVTARGTEEGLIIRMDGRVSITSLKTALQNFVEGRRGFLCGNAVTVEWVGSKPDAQVTEEISKYLNDEFDMTVQSARLKEERPKKAPTQRHKVEEITPEDRELSLFDGIDALGLPDNENKFDPLERETRESSDSFLWDEADTRLICTTFRSGQRIETEHSIVIFGDVNSGAEIVAGGDIIVLGTLRGVAHAGAYDETGGGRVIFALTLQPTQLRIGTVISRGGNEELRETKHVTAPEIARVDGTNIVVERYQSRNVYGLLAR